MLEYHTTSIVMLPVATEAHQTNHAFLLNTCGTTAYCLQLRNWLPRVDPVQVFQEYNAGPHTEGDYSSWMLCEFEKRGWKLELQAPQGLTYICYPYNLYWVYNTLLLLLASSQAHIRMFSMCLFFPLCPIDTARNFKL